MSEPKVAVILPFRDAFKTLERSVLSILNQSFQDIELVLVNDGSTDGSRELISEIKDTRIRIIDLPSSGTVIALNEGIFSCTANYIALIDPYDWARNDRIQLQFNFLNNHSDVDVISSKVNYIHESADRNIRSYIQWTNSILSFEEIFHKRFVNSTVLHSTVMFRKELISAYGEFVNGEFPEDYEIFLRWMDKGIKFVKLDDELTEWHDDLQRLSRRHIKYNSSGAAKIKAKYFKTWLGGYFRHKPELFLWGANHANLRKFNWLEKEGLKISGFIDLVDKHTDWFEENPVFHIEQIPSRSFIICFVEQFEPSDIPELLSRNGLEEGTHFILMS